MTDRKFQKVTVLGAGRWGTAMAIFLSRKELQVTLQCHSQKTFEYLQKKDRSPNLRDYSCEGKVLFEKDLNQSVNGAEVVIISTPVPFLRETLKSLTELSPQTLLVGINKGIERHTIQTVPEIVREFFPHHIYAHLGGPCFPQGLLSDTTPAAETLACENEEATLQLQELLNAPGFRVYRSKEVQGVAILGAIKNVFALAAGALEGMGMYEEALSVLLTRGLAEIRRIGSAMKIAPESIYGMAGLGDLALTCYSPGSSHNKNFGRRIGKGERIEEILDSMEGTIAEGYFTAQALWELGRKLRLDLPLTNTIYQVLYEGMDLREGLVTLMKRPLKEED